MADVTQDFKVMTFPRRVGTEISMAETEMPGFMAIREEFGKSQPLEGAASPAACT
jgi:adenosylhomocysteinase